MLAMLDGPAVGADPDMHSGGAKSQLQTGSQRDPSAQGLRGGIVDAEYQSPVAHASAVIRELPDGVPFLSAVVREGCDSRGIHRTGECTS